MCRNWFFKDERKSDIMNSYWFYSILFQLLVCTLSVVDDTRLLTKVSSSSVYLIKPCQFLTKLNIILQIVIQELQTMLKELVLDKVFAFALYKLMHCTGTVMLVFAVLTKPVFLLLMKKDFLWLTRMEGEWYYSCFIHIVHDISHLRTWFVWIYLLLLSLNRQVHNSIHFVLFTGDGHKSKPLKFISGGWDKGSLRNKPSSSRTRG